MSSNIKVTLTAFFYSHGVVHHEHAPQGQIITKERETREDIMTATTAKLNTIPKEAFSECFQTMAALLGEVCGVTRLL